MQVLYVVEFRVESRSPQVDPYTTVLDDIGSWLSYVAERQIDRSELETTGSMELPPNPRSQAERAAAWDVVRSSNSRVIRLEVRDTDVNADSVFVTRLTLGRIDSKTTVRVSMAREISPTWLSPAPPADLRQPSIIGRLASNDSIVLSIRGQQQDGRYLQVRTDAEVETLAGVIRSTTRLPILLVHTRTLPALAVAWKAATKLVGLVRVVTLDYRASRALNDWLPGFAPPLAGARLIWSDPGAPTVVFGEAEVNNDDPEVLRARLMRLISPVSVLARGVDTAYRKARQIELSERERNTREQSRHALEQGDVGAQIDALQNELNAVRASAEEWQQLAIDEEQRADRFQSEAERVPALEAQVEQLSVAFRATVHSEDTDSDPWDDLPELRSGDSESAENLFLRLSDAASGRIVFTERAATSWKKCRYPFPDEMAECLVKLGRVAASLYDGTERSIDHLDNWIRDEFDLKVALQDSVIERDTRLWKFIFDDVERDRTPHVKVRDHAPPSEVGRIHFALDAENHRLIVDHVALKLY